MVFIWSPDDNVALKVPKCFGVNKKRRNASVEMLPKNISQTNSVFQLEQDKVRTTDS